MPGRLQRARRRLRGWLQAVLPPTWMVIVYFIVMLGLEATFHWFAIPAIPDGAQTNRLELQRLLHQPRDILLAFGLVFYAGFRVLAKHPWYNPNYADWLKRTPWREGLPLPLGPATLAPQDGLVLLGAWLWSFDASGLQLGDLITLFVAPFLVAQLLPIWTSGSSGRVFSVLMGLALVAWLRPSSPSPSWPSPLATWSC